LDGTSPTYHVHLIWDQQAPEYCTSNVKGARVKISLDDISLYLDDNLAYVDLDGELTSRMPH